MLAGLCHFHVSSPTYSKSVTLPDLFGTYPPLKFNIAPKNWPSQNEPSLLTTIFAGAMLALGRVSHIVLKGIFSPKHLQRSCPSRCEHPPTLRLCPSCPWSCPWRHELEPFKKTCFFRTKKTVSAFQVSFFFGRRWQQKSSVLKFVLGGGGVFSRRKPPATGASIVFFDGG